MQHSNDAGAYGKGSSAVSDQLIAELERADVVVIGTPMHNLSVPSSLKAWIDHVVRARRTFTMATSGKKGMLHDRPVYIAVASGGRFSGTNAHQPDFLTPYLKAVLASIGLNNLLFFSVEGTGARAESVELARRVADQALMSHFNSLELQHASENLD
jgi:FMN-dependent NADH-azoreductase